MCLIVFAWRPGHPLPLVLAGNRDEFHARPTAALGPWPDAPGVYAGRDLEAGGTWMGIGPGGRFAAVTNIRAPGARHGSLSRGALPAGYLAGALSLRAYAEQVYAERARYSGFNLLLSDGESLCHLASEQPPRWLPAGVYGLSNAGLDTPWPKLVKARGALAEALPEALSERLFSLLQDHQVPADADLPDTGVGLETERRLSTAFIRGANYGTRASTLLYLYGSGEREVIERSFGPQGVPMGEVRITAFSAPAG
ncbi:NRDE family protein [Pseudomonas sp. NPDC007930]|uniref:NRDE family protein n=1 Tax=Pseudomonas sp. NPDC007930 TaxID=3364417 RepID=UPI0036E301EF